MSDSVLQSLKQSSLVNSLKSEGMKNDYDQEEHKSSVNTASQILKISSKENVNSAGGQKLNFEIPVGMGFLTDGFLYLDTSAGVSTNALNDESYGSLGLTGYKYIKVKTKKSELCRFHPVPLIYDQFKHKQSKDFFNATGTVWGLTTDPLKNAAYTNKKDYLPFSLLPFADLKKSLDCDFLEKLMIEVETVESSLTKKTTNDDHVINDVSAVLKFNKMQSDDYRKYLSKNMPKGGKVSRMVYSHYVENSKTVTTASATENFTINMDISNPHFTVQTYVMVRPNDESSGNRRTKNGWWMCAPVVDLELNGDGRKIYSCSGDFFGCKMALNDRHFELGEVQSDLGTFDRFGYAYQNGGSMGREYGLHQIACIDWRRQDSGVHEDFEKGSLNMLDGGVSMGSISSKNLKIVVAKEAGTTEMEVIVVHKVARMLEIDCDTGAITAKNLN